MGVTASLVEEDSEAIRSSRRSRGRFGCSSSGMSPDGADGADCGEVRDPSASGRDLGDRGLLACCGDPAADAGVVSLTCSGLGVGFLCCMRGSGDLADCGPCRYCDASFHGACDTCDCPGAARFVMDSIRRMGGSARLGSGGRVKHGQHHDHGWW